MTNREMCIRMNRVFGQGETMGIWGNEKSLEVRVHVGTALILDIGQRTFSPILRSNPSQVILSVVNDTPVALVWDGEKVEPKPFDHSKNKPVASFNKTDFPNYHSFAPLRSVLVIPDLPELFMKEELKGEIIVYYEGKSTFFILRTNTADGYNIGRIQMDKDTRTIISKAAEEEKKQRKLPEKETASLPSMNDRLIAGEILTLDGEISPLSVDQPTKGHFYVFVVGESKRRLIISAADGLTAKLIEPGTARDINVQKQQFAIQENDFDTLPHIDKRKKGIPSLRLNFKFDATQMTCSGHTGPRRLFVKRAGFKEIDKYLKPEPEIIDIEQ